MVTWEWRDGAHVAYEGGSVRAVVRRRVDGSAWNLHLHDLEWPRGLFPYRSPETAMKHATRWLERRTATPPEKLRLRTRAMFGTAPVRQNVKR